eukprot:g1921.t1
MSKIYYRAGKPDKHEDPNGGKVGHIMGIEDYIAKDETRAAFLKKFKESATFRSAIGWDEKPQETYIKEWKERARTGGRYVQPRDHVNEKGVHDGLMCTHLYELGSFVGFEGDKKVRILKKDGKEAVFDKKTETCVYDPSHDGPDIPDDVVAIQGFGEAAMLKVMRRRISEKFNIYTYVGDVVLALNPYMFIPAMIDIAEPPNVKKYELGKDPNVYATAHFAYWGLRDPDTYNPVCAPSINQSCPVSGESGAGKTVACTYIMKYLAKLSDWRMAELGRKKAGKDTTTLVGGVSPFLEGFGNAKTTMNDNSSRFGKFTKILFDDGMIVGAEMVHYLLEKARLVDQGEHERNYHAFYGLIKGATKEERSKYGLKSVESYDMLMHGHSAIVEHETNPDGTNTYDEERMNNPLVEGDPDKTGYRAAFAAAGVDAKAQSYVWDAIAAMLKMGNLKFAKDGKGSKVTDIELCKDIERLIGVKDLAKHLVVYRRELPEGIIDSPVAVSGANDNRNALVKTFYGHMFHWLFYGVCNKVLKPNDGSSPAGFVGLLDIFGFEVFKKNSLEQLCINFANEKLQKLFNDHVFQTERTVYHSQHISDDCIPPYEDNTPCCNLVERSRKGFMGVLPHLNDMRAKDTPEENHKLDELYCKDLIKQWGRKMGVSKSAKTKLEKDASKRFYAKKNVGNKWFIVRHFAGDVKYWVEGWVTKNVDLLPLQLNQMMRESTVKFVRDIFLHAGKAGSKTIAKTFVHDLGTLATTLEKTNPHYVKCVKPNDIHFRPVDGRASFNAWKTYRQLKFAGVMEVCKIKMQGYPFRLPYEKFWNGRCVRNRYHVFANLDPGMQAKDGCEAMCKLVMPGPQKSVVDGKMRPTWLLGKSWLFGKEFLPDTFTKWHRSKVIKIVQSTVRGYAFAPRLKEAMYAKAVLVKKWKEKLLIRRAQAAVRTIQRAYVPFRSFESWSKTKYQLGRIEIVRKATVAVQRAWRSFTIYPRYANAFTALVRKKAHEHLEAIVAAEVDRVKHKLAESVMAMKLRETVVKLRRRRRVQARIRGALARVALTTLQRALALQKLAAFKVEAFWAMTFAAEQSQRRRSAILKMQSIFRMALARKMFTRKRAMRCAAHAFARMVVRRKRYLAKREAQMMVARWYRWYALRRSYTLRNESYRKIERVIFEHMLRITLRNYIVEMNKACVNGDLSRVVALLTTEVAPWKQDDPVEKRGRFWRLARLAKERVRYQGMHVFTYSLTNMREPVMWTAPVQSAVKSGNKLLVEYLIKRGASVDVRDAIYDTPLHQSCKCGDESLDISKILYGASRHMDASGEIKWVLGMSAMNRDDHTVLDVAAAAEYKNETINWLVEEGAKCTLKIEDLLVDEADKERQKEIFERQLQEREALEEETKLRNDPSYAFLMMAPSEGARDPMVRKLKKQKADMARKAKHKANISRLVMHARTIQSVFRAFIMRRKLQSEQNSAERQQMIREARAKIEQSAKRRRMQKRQREVRKERMYAAMKKKSEDDMKYRASTEEKANHFAERLRLRTEQRRERRIQRAVLDAKRAQREVSARGLRMSAVERDIEGLIAETLDPDALPPKPAEKKFTRYSTMDPPGLEDDTKASLHAAPRTLAPSPTRSLREMQDSMRAAVASKMEREYEREALRAEAASKELALEASRLARQIRALKASREEAEDQLLSTVPREQVKSLNWFYRDLDRNIFGPYDGQTMHEWTAQGFFGPDLEIAMTADGPFRKLGRAFPVTETAFLELQKK